MLTLTILSIGSAVLVGGYWWKKGLPEMKPVEKPVEKPVGEYQPRHAPAPGRHSAREYLEDWSGWTRGVAEGMMSSLEYNAYNHHNLSAGIRARFEKFTDTMALQAA